MSISEHKHMPEPVRRMEVFTGVGRRRSWSSAEKAAIIAESYSPGETVCAIARRHGLTPQQLFTWRRLARRLALLPPPMFVPAVVEPAEPESPLTVKAARRRCRRSKADGIELQIAGVGVRVGADAKPRTIEAVISRTQGELVIGPSGNVRVLVATKPVDFRKGAEGLAAVVRETMRTDPFSGVVYVFRAKRADRVKLIFWDGSGVVLVAKRLESGHFRWPTIRNGVMRLSATQLQALLEGLDWRRVHEPRRTVVPTAAS